MNQEPFRRWQQRSIEQKQTTSALLLGLAAAALGFSASEVAGQSSFVGCCASALFHLQGIALVVSIGFGAAFSFNRVRSFDATAKVARTRGKNPKDSKLSDLRAEMRRLDALAKRLFFTQAWSFVVGTVLFLVLVLALNRDVLYGTKDGGQQAPGHVRSKAVVDSGP